MKSHGFSLAALAVYVPTDSICMLTWTDLFIYLFLHGEAVCARHSLRHFHLRNRQNDE